MAFVVAAAEAALSGVVLRLEQAQLAAVMALKITVLQVELLLQIRVLVAAVALPMLAVALADQALFASGGMNKGLSWNTR